MSTLRFALVAIVLGVAVISGCDESRVVGPVADTFLMEGEVADIGTDVHDSGRPAMLVENPESLTNYSRVIFFIADDTLIQTGNPAVGLPVDDLAVGEKVRVWTRGTVIDTDPALAEAGRVEILER